MRIRANQTEQGYPKVKPLSEEEKQRLEERVKTRRELYEQHYRRMLAGQNQVFKEQFDHPTNANKGWINHLRLNARTGGSYNTYHSYKYRSIYFLDWVKRTGKHPFTLTVEDAVEFQTFLQHLTTTYRGFDMTNSHRNRIMDAVKNLYDYLLLRGVGYMDENNKLVKLPLNPFRLLPNLREEVVIEDRFLTPDETRRFIDLVNESVIASHYKIAIMLGLYAGLRISETIMVEFQDVIPRKIEDKEYLIIRIRFGKGRKIRETIYVDEETKPTLQEYSAFVEKVYQMNRVLVAQRPDLVDLGAKNAEYNVRQAEKFGLSPEIVKNSIEQIIANELTENNVEDTRKLVPVSLININKIMYLLGKAITKQLTERGEPTFKFTFHRLRHTFAKTLTRKGIPLETVGHLLGHSSLETTRGYAEIDTERAIKDIFLR